MRGKLDHLNRAVSIKEIESIINSLPKKTTVGPDGFTGEFYQPFKEEMIPSLYNFFRKIETEDMYLIAFYESSITLIPTQDKDITRKENYRTTPLNVDTKIPQ